MSWVTSLRSVVEQLKDWFRKGTRGNDLNDISFPLNGRSATENAILQEKEWQWYRELRKHKVITRLTQRQLQTTTRHGCGLFEALSARSFEYERLQWYGFVEAKSSANVLALPGKYYISWWNCWIVRYQLVRRPVRFFPLNSCTTALWSA